MKSEIIVDTQTLRSVAKSIEDNTVVMNTIISFMSKFGKSVEGLTQEQSHVASMLKPFSLSIQADRIRLEREVEALHLAAAQLNEAASQSTETLAHTLERIEETVSLGLPEVQSALEQASTKISSEQHILIKYVSGFLEDSWTAWSSSLEALRTHVEAFPEKQVQAWTEVAGAVESQLHAFTESTEATTRAVSAHFEHLLQENLSHYTDQIEHRMSTRINEQAQNLVLRLNEVLLLQDQRLEDALGRVKRVADRVHAIEREVYAKQHAEEQVVQRFERVFMDLQARDEALMRKLQATLMNYEDRLKQQMERTEELLEEHRSSGVWNRVKKTFGAE